MGGLEVDAEKVAALHPDLVLAIAEGNAQGTVRALEAAGLPVTVTPSGSLDAVLEGIRDRGRSAGSAGGGPAAWPGSSRGAATRCGPRSRAEAAGRAPCCSSGRTRRRRRAARPF